MITENLTTLNIHKLTQEQYNREFIAGNIDENALYFTTDDSQEQIDSINEILSAIQEELDDKAEEGHNHDGSYYKKNEIDSKVNAINSAIDGKAAKAEDLSGYGIKNAYTKTEVDSKIAESVKDYALATDGDNVYLSESGKSTSNTPPVNAGCISGIIVDNSQYNFYPAEHSHSTSDIASGTLGVARGGTGKTTHTSNAILTGNGTGAVKNVATASGAFYATSANGAAQFGTLPIAQGGTGSTTAAGALTNLGITATAAEINKLDGVTATTAEINYLDGVTSNIQSQLDSKAAVHDHPYAGSSTHGGSATSAVKLDSSAGSTTQPVWFENGKPKATTYSLGKSVPSDAKFTDTTYSDATTSASGLMSADDKTKLSGIETGAQKNTITGVKGNSESSYRTGNVNITKTNIGLGNVDNTSDANKPVSTAQQSAIDAAKSAANTYTDQKIAN